MTTTNRSLVNQVENTLQPGVAFNLQADVFDKRFGNLTIEFTADANLTLTQEQSDYSMLLFTDSPSTLTAGRDVILPANFPLIFVRNATAQTLTLKKSGQTGVTVAAAAKILIASGPTDVEKL